MTVVSIQTLVDNLPVPAAVIGPDGRVVCANARMASVSARSVEGRKCHEALAGKTEPCPSCRIEDLLSGTIPNQRQTASPRPSGTVSVCLETVRDANGNILILEKIGSPVARAARPAVPKRDNADTASPELLDKLAALLQIGRDLMGKAPVATKMDKVITSLTTALGRGSDASVWIRLDGTVYGEATSDNQQSIATRDVVVEGKHRGQVCVAAAATESLRPEEGFILEETAELIGLQVEILDLEAMLRQSEDRYKKLAANLAREIWARTEALEKDTGYLEGILRCSGDMIITTDLESRIVQFNPGAEAMLGYTAEEMHGRPAFELWVDPREREKILEEIAVTGGVRNHETLLRTKSGDVIEISLSLSLLNDEEGKVIGTVGVSKNIGKEKAIIRELERLNENYREIIHFINHENKNSLIVMGGFLRRLLSSETNPARARELGIVYHHAQFLEAMSRDYLVMAELEHGELQVRKQRITDFYHQVIYPAMIGIKERYPDFFQSYDTSMGGVKALEVWGDPALLEIVYRNLFGNALKYRSPDGKIAYGVEDHGDSLLFNVWNAGPGVPTQEAEKIFHKFYRVMDENTKQKRGTGLGLYNIRRIIEAHGGRIWCETIPGEWINFLFTLPKQ